MFSTHEPFFNAFFQEIGKGVRSNSLHPERQTASRECRLSQDRPVQWLIGLDSRIFPEYAGSMDIDQNAPWEKLERTIRQEPTKSVLLATIAGFVLCILPVGRLIGLVIKLLFVLIKPALIVLGVVKLWEASRRV
jgi:hypothetical protein